MIKNKKIVVFLLATSIILSFIVLSKGYNKFFKVVYPIRFEKSVSYNADYYGVDKSLIYAVIKTESNFDSTAVSKAGAIGLMQIMPNTFEWLQSKENTSEKLETDSLFDPNLNIKYGTFLISMLKKRYNNEKAILSAYNAGMGKVDTWLNNPEISEDGQTLTYVPYPETENYVNKVLKSKKMYSQLYFDN